MWANYGLLAKATIMAMTVGITMTVTVTSIPTNTILLKFLLPLLLWLDGVLVLLLLLLL